MGATTKALADDRARRAAIAAHDRSLLIEAGAGSGKTALMAGRIVMMLAQGILPKSIAAVTFTELAASELMMRVRDFVDALVAGAIPPELRIALPEGLSDTQRAHLATASKAIDEITCSTIHGFCQRLIRPYPVEADIDPGASVMDRSQADLAFIEIVESWLRDRLSAGEGGLIAEMVLQNPAETLALIHKILDSLRRRPTVVARAAAPIPPLVQRFRNEAAAFVDFVRQPSPVEEETSAIATRFGEMSEALAFALTGDDPATLVRLLVSRPDSDLCTKAGSFCAFKKKTKWIEAAKRAGLGKADGERLYTLAGAHYEACRDAWQAMLQNVASRVLADVLAELRPVLQRFRDHKRSTASLDFDDLIFAARDLLRDHDEVRQKLARRYAHVLVDEFQDTDPLQTEIFWRLCGDLPAGKPAENWTKYRLRPGALFLVGDPKQAIYRFRGADVAAYLRARDAFVAQDNDSILSISTNFRSCAPILTYVNERFEAVLRSDGQPGFTALDPFHADRGGMLCVAALDVTVTDGNGKASAEQRRDGEAEAVAEMCARLIGRERIMDRKSGDSRLCRPGDIALLAPTGRDLWRYEEALERRDIPVATQAGKGLFRRQEIQDLIALTRVLADRRDTLALGALLRGPIVGLTDEELLDIVWALPRSEDVPDALPRLDLGVDPAAIPHPLARDIVEKLQALYRRANSTTPHALLSQAVDVLRVRPILLQRHRGQAERALANVDLYLSLTRAYAVRGLRALAEAMTAAWIDESRAVEGRPDAQEESVALYTMHAAKGLEWPIVVPVNTMTAIMAADTAVTDRENDYFYCPVFGVRPVGYDDARDAEQAELDRERVRLWYVATTRARELLIIPRLDAPAAPSAWISLLDLSLTDLPAIDLSHLPAEAGVAEAPPANDQTREVFAGEAAVIADRHLGLVWIAPSRDEGTASPVLQAEGPDIMVPTNDDEPADGGSSNPVQGGRERGLIIHKLLEEVLTGETEDHLGALTDRASELIRALGQPIAEDPATGLSPAEIAGCVVRTLALPDIVALRPTLVPEFPVYASDLLDGVEEVTAGITDATSFAADGTPQVVVDWKSDVAPAPETIEHYRAQVRNYLSTTGAETGLIVFITTGTVMSVLAPGAQPSRAHLLRAS
jgi:ATP-dependent exoDNAse (exonuclease V) beta subunit